MTRRLELFEKTSRVSGFETGHLLRARNYGHTVLVWRERPGLWCWCVIGWTTGLAWARVTGGAATWDEALIRGRDAMRADFL